MRSRNSESESVIERAYGKRDERAAAARYKVFSAFFHVPVLAFGKERKAVGDEVFRRVFYGMICGVRRFEKFVKSRHKFSFRGRGIVLRMLRNTAESFLFSANI